MNVETRVGDIEAGGEAETLIQDQSERRSRRSLIIGIVVIALALAVAAFFLFGGESAGESDAAAEQADEQAPTVTVIVPGSGSVDRTINANGTIAARREMPVGVAGEGGQIVRVLVEPGQWVKEGQVLAVIDQSVQTQQARSQAAQVEVAKADAELAQAELDRALKLVERGFISKADIDRRTASRDAAVARVEVARAQLRELQARSGRLNIRAPEAGLVLERNAEPGQVVSPGSGVLFRMASGGQMELRARMSEADLLNIGPGTVAKVTPAGSEKTYDGQVWQVSPVVDPSSRQGIARIALGYDPAFRPGGFANAEIISGTGNSPVLPESAVQSDEKGSYVYIVNKSNKIERRDITIGAITANGIAITAGLTGKERVVLYAAGFLNPGETVRPARESGS